MTTFLGNSVTFTGKQLQVGDIAKDFLLIATDLSQKSLKDFEGKRKLLALFLLLIQVFVQNKHVLLMRNYQS